MTPRERSAFLAIRHAAENASRVPIDDAMIAAILRGEGGDQAHLAAVFGDVSPAALEAAGAALGIPFPQVLAAYRDARTAVGAANRALDAALADPVWAEALSRRA